MKRDKPGPGQESVWDYPRPPRAEAAHRRVTIELGGRTVADSTAAVRVLETSHPPVYYLPPGDFAAGVLTPSDRTSFCEFKGMASYVNVGDQRDAGWFYPHPSPGFASIRDLVAVYPGRMDAAYVDGEQVQAQAGDFYGGWITADIVGPFKGGPGTWGW